MHFESHWPRSGTEGYLPKGKTMISLMRPNVRPSSFDDAEPLARARISTWSPQVPRSAPMNKGRTLIGRRISSGILPG